MSLTARTRPLHDTEPTLDPLAVCGDDGVLWASPELTLAGWGVAQRLAVDRADPAGAAAAVTAALAAIEWVTSPHAPGPSSTSPVVAQGPATGPLALGAWPFDPAAPGELVVPNVVVAVDASGARWLTTVTDGDGGAHDDLAEATWARAASAAATLAGFSVGEPTTPSRFDVRSARPPAAWCDAVAAARDELRAGVADKVVMAREVTVEADSHLSVAAIAARLAQRFPASLRFVVDGFVGASPELLVERHDEIVRCHPMAGTAPRVGDPEADAALVKALAASPKNALEHRHTIDLVHETLLPYCSYLDEEAEPSVVHLANVTHLATRLEGKLSSPPASVVELVGVLHPTPAVCGRPRAEALELIARFEDLDRDRYAGPVGWVDHHGNGAFAVGIRSAVVDGATARVFAGVGVVPDSDPRAELAETRAKLDAVLPAVVRP
ncbi:MAG: isochorismate synthase [Acidimicrobiia bacterium]|nr:isochorismate synthase [Acidimicrobiia bacterium]